MLTIRTIEHIKTGARITLLNGIYAILLGIFYAIFSGFIMKIDFRAIESSWGFFERYNHEISSLFLKYFILISVIIIAVGVCIIYLSFHILKKKEKATWVVLFIIGIVFWSGLLTVEILNKNIYTICLGFIGWASFILGMIIPIKYYTEKSYDTY